MLDRAYTDACIACTNAVIAAVRDFTDGAVTLDTMVAKRTTEPERVA